MSKPGSSVLAENRRPKRANQYGLRACAAVQWPLENLATLRQQLGPPGGKTFPPAFLKPSDEQTVVAVAAVLRAIEQHSLERINFGGWGVIAAPRYLGRISATETIYKVETGGAWKAPPLFVAHRSLHAVSGTISQALQCKGPNFGVGGGPNAPVEGLLTALTLLDEYKLPGLWLVLTQCDPEPRPDHKGINTVPVVCHALALAFVPVVENWRGPRLRLLEATANPPSKPTAASNGPEPSGLFAGLTRFIEQGSTSQRFGIWSCSLKWGCELQLTDEA